MDAQTWSSNLYDALGRGRTISMIWHCTPFPIRCLSLPYGVYVYTRLLRECDSLEALRRVHEDLYRQSLLFRLLRPRYRRIESYIVGCEKRDSQFGSSSSALPAGENQTPQRGRTERPKGPIRFVILDTKEGAKQPAEQAEASAAAAP